MSDIFREIDAELRRDNLEQLWKRYGAFIIALAVVVVIATAGVVGWRAYQQRQHEAQGVQYASALDLVHQGKDADAAAAFAEIAKKADSGRAVLARLEEAASKINSNDVAGAIAVYDQVAGDASLDPGFRDAATLLSARYTLDKGDPQMVIAKLQPLTVAASPWRGMALELSALAELKAGNTAKAHGDFETLSKDATVPQGVRQRAGEIAATLAP